MFIDPEPRKPRHEMSSGLATPRAPSAPAHGRDRTPSKRKALHERSQSQNNRDRARLPLGGQSLDKLTVRLIPQSPASSTKEKSSPDDWVADAYVPNKENSNIQTVASRVWALSNKLDQDETFLKPVQQLQQRPPDIVDIDLSETTVGTNDDERPPTPRRNTARLRTKPPPQIVPPKPSWHRRSASSGVMSESSTLYQHRDSEGSAAYDGSTLQPFDEKHHSYLSLGTTLHGTPTPVERNFPAQTDHEDFAKPSMTPPSQLHAWPEISPERATVRVVDSPAQRDLSDQMLPSEASMMSLARTMSIGSELGVIGVAQQARVIRRTNSTSSIPNVQTFDFSPSPSFRDDTTSLLASEDTRMFLPQSPEQFTYNTSDERSEYDLRRTPSNVEFSSPNIVTYSTPPPRSPTRRQLHTAPSYDSIESRLHHPTMLLSDTTPSFAERTSAPSTINRASSTDTLPNLYLPKKRLRSRDIATEGLPGSRDGPESGRNIDQGSLVRHAFSTHLSTIMSESDRADSRHMSQFSANSDAFVNYPSEYLNQAPSWSSQNYQHRQLSSSNAHQDDDASEFYREQSAMPLPLFQTPYSAAREVQDDVGSYSEPVQSASILTSAGEREESVDQLAELYPSRLRGMRSGQSLRQRSNSTPSHSQPSSQSHSRHMSLASYQSSNDRPTSNSSSVFPFWAKQYYGHGVALMSHSSVSLELANSQRPPLIYSQQRQPPMHSRGGSEWTDITSSFDGSRTESSASSRFLPSIFRPRTRIRHSDQRDGVRTAPFFRIRRSHQQSSVERRDDRSESMTFRPVSTSEGGDREMEQLPPSNARANRGTSEVPTEATVRNHTPRPVSTSPISPRQSRIRRSGAVVQSVYDQDHEQSANRQHRSSTANVKGNRIVSAQQAQTEAEVRSSSNNFRLEGTPHLYMTRRTAGQGLPTFRAPSFVDSLDTLVREKGNRQILLFVLGFACPLFWLVGAFLPIPPLPTLDETAVDLGLGMSASPSWIVPNAGDSRIPTLEPERPMRQSTDPNILLTRGMTPSASYHDQDFATVDSTIRHMMQQERQEQQSQVTQELAAHYSAERWNAERACLKARWWRTLNRIMSVVGILVIGAIIALAIVATSH